MNKKKVLVTKLDWLLLLLLPIQLNFSSLAETERNFITYFCYGSQPSKTWIPLSFAVNTSLGIQAFLLVLRMSYKTISFTHISRHQKYGAIVVGVSTGRAQSLTLSQWLTDRKLCRYEKLRRESLRTGFLFNEFFSLRVIWFGIRWDVRSVMA